MIAIGARLMAETSRGTSDQSTGQTNSSASQESPSQAASHLPLGKEQRQEPERGDGRVGRRQKRAPESRKDEHRHPRDGATAGAACKEHRTANAISV